MSSFHFLRFVPFLSFHLCTPVLTLFPFTPGILLRLIDLIPLNGNCKQFFIRPFFCLRVFSPVHGSFIFMKSDLASLFPLQLLSFILSSESHIRWVQCSLLLLGDVHDPPWCRCWGCEVPVSHGELFTFFCIWGSMNQTRNAGPFPYFF